MDASVDINGISTDAARAQKTSIQSWDWSIMNYRGFGRKSEFTVSEEQSIPSRVKARMEIHGRTSCLWVDKRYTDRCTGLDWPLGLQEFEAPRFQANRHIKVVKLSAVCTGRLYSPYTFLSEAESTLDR
jgi:hypothetical protein